MTVLPHARLLVLPVLVLGAGLAGAQQALLDSPTRSWSTGQQVTTDAYRPSGQVLVDLDADGDLDVVHSHYGNFIDPRFSVLSNHGDGTFGAPLSVQTSGETMDVVAADLDGDGDPDLAFAQSSSGISGQAVLVFLNDGAGGFGPQKSFPCGVGPTGIAALDADQDGDVDLVTANWRWGEEDLSLLYNDGAAGFAQRTDIAILPGQGAQPTKLAAGDVDGDGWPDLAVTVRSGAPSVVLLLNDQAGGFTAGPQLDGSYPYSIEIPGVTLGDADNDGDLDVLYSTDLFRNQGGGSFGPAETVAWTPLFGFTHELAIADVSGDGWPDLLGVPHSSDFGWFLVPGVGGGQFGGVQSYETGEMARTLDVADMDSDGDLDVVVANTGSINVSVHKSEAGSFWMPPAFVTGGMLDLTHESDTGDIDGDGDVDVVTLNSQIVKLVNSGSGVFSVAKQDPGTGSILDHPKLRDLDGDGDLDLLMLKNTTIGGPPCDLYTALNDGAGSFGSVSQWPLASGGTGDAATLDLDLDGDLDVVVTEYLGGNNDGRKLYLLLNNGNGTFQAPLLVKDFTIPHLERVLAGDLDGDGDDDIIAGGGGGITTWLSDGAGGLSGPFVSDLGAGGAKYMTAADLDLDGHLDVATAGFGNTFQGETLTIKRGYGDGGFKAPETYYGMFSLQYSGLGGLDVLDADLDGDPDLVAGAYGANDVALWLNAGDGSFAPEQRYGVSGSVTFVRVGDFDGDGRDDVAVNKGRDFTVFALESAVAILFGEAVPPAVSVYCTPKTSSQGCAPAISWSGTPSASSSAPFLVTASQVINNKNGLAFFGYAPAALPALGGTLCVQPPVARTSLQVSGGNPPPDDCSGTYSLDLNALIQSGAYPGLQVGRSVYVQYWQRDPADPFGSGLSNALELVIQP